MEYLSKYQCIHQQQHGGVLCHLFEFAIISLFIVIQRIRIGKNAHRLIGLCFKFA